jgi:ferredoxin
VKGFARSWRQAFAVRESACEACGLCVKHCPEGAIELVRRGS